MRVPTPTVAERGSLCAHADLRKSSHIGTLREFVRLAKESARRPGSPLEDSPYARVAHALLELAHPWKTTPSPGLPSPPQERLRFEDTPLSLGRCSMSSTVW